MTDTIALTGIRAKGRHGVLEHEKIDAQTFEVDVRVEVQLRLAAQTDDVHQTINYAELAASIVDIIEGESVDLIETLADRIAHRCLEHPTTTAVEVTVHKPQAPMPEGFGTPSVHIRRGHEDYQ